MIYLTTVLQRLCGSGTYEALIHTLYNQSKDFPGIYRNYLDAVAQLRAELGKSTRPNVDMLVTAIEMQCCSNMLFAGFRGLQMNYEHFCDPMQPNITCPQVDFSDALREELSFTLPMYRSAQAVINDFWNLLSEEQKERFYAPICEYEAALLAAAPKLAHYYGYMLGNELLRLIVPAYHDDPALDARYCHILEKYFDGALDTSQWDGCFDPKTWKFAPFEPVDEITNCVLREQIFHYRCAQRTAK